MKKFLSLALILALLLCLVPTALGEYIQENPEGSTIERFNKNDSMTRNLGTVKQNYGLISRNAKKNTDNGTVKGTVIENYGTIQTNQGPIQTNSGTVEENTDSIRTNAKDGTVEDNEGPIQTNEGTVYVNHMGATIIENLGTVQSNGFMVEVNNGTVEVNNSKVVANDGTVEVNNGTVETNNGIVETNNGTVATNNGTVAINGFDGVFTNGDGGSVEVNIGTEITPAGVTMYSFVFANDLTLQDMTAYFNEHTVDEVKELLDDPETIVIVSKEADTFFYIDSKALFEKKGYSQEGWFDNLTGKYYGFGEFVYMDKPYWFIPYWKEINASSTRKSRSTQRTLSVNASKVTRNVVLEVITPGVDAAEDLIDGCIGVLLGNTYADMLRADPPSVKLDGKALTDEQYTIVEYSDGSVTILFTSDLIRSLSSGTHPGAIRIGNTEITFALTVAAV